MEQNSSRKMPAGSAVILVWFKGLPQPTAFQVTGKEAKAAMLSYHGGEDTMLRFVTIPDGRGLQAQNSFLVSELRGLTIECPTMTLVGE